VRFTEQPLSATGAPNALYYHLWAAGRRQDDGGLRAFTIDAYCALFRQHEATIYFVELEATQAERIWRNRTEFRLAQKASKRDILQSEKRLVEAGQRYKLNSDNNFFYQENYIKLNNTDLTAEQTASHIVQAFGFHAIEQPKE
jgi:hypothetical protein